MTIPFFKMSGAGNDFIIIDNMEHNLPAIDLSRLAARICRRKMSVGADGLIILEPSVKADFKWRFFNSDGSIAEMCGNGARCAAWVASHIGLGGEYLRFETLAGTIEAQICKDTVKIKMTDPGPVVLNEQIRLDGVLLTYCGINTGVPHVVLEAADIEQAPVVSQGRTIRFHDRFAPSGTNVNYISAAGPDTWYIRTYERGVEDETLACGTGNVAAALVLAACYGTSSPTRFKTRSGSYLTVYFKQADEGRFHHIYLEGDARVIYTADLHPDAWQYEP